MSPCSDGQRDNTKNPNFASLKVPSLPTIDMFKGEIILKLGCGLYWAQQIPSSSCTAAGVLN